jgi:hypothetical protein
MDLPQLKAYQGTQSSLIHFTSDYYLYFASWDSTPTKFSSYYNIWLITPKDKRILFADPPDSSEIACIYHNFQEVYGGAISLDWPSENHLQVQCGSHDGKYELSLEFYLKETISSRLLVALAKSPPTSFMVSKPMVSLSNFLVNLLATKGGLTVFGKTETGQPFYTGAVDRLMFIKDGTATLNGNDLGDVSSPTWQPEFGDVIPPVRSVIRLGTLYLPYDDEMISESV